MKGITFNIFSDMVEDKFGIKVWDALLQVTQQDRIYLSTETYPDEQLIALFAAAVEKSCIPANDLVTVFVEFVFPHLQHQNSGIFEKDMTLKQCMLGVNRIIHGEAGKPHPDTRLPTFEYADENDQEPSMLYRLSRKLRMLVEGLIAGAATHFASAYALSHNERTHAGADRCTLHPEFV